MSLSRQLLIIIVVLFLLMFVGTFTISMNNTRNYLAEQLKSHAQDTATSLGLSISRFMELGDNSSVETTVNAIFDRGYYREIVVADLKGKPLVKRENPVVIKGIPDWFIAFVPLPTPRTESEVQKGWSQVGMVYVTSHPGYAYDELWRNATGTLRWFLGGALGSILIGMLLIRVVLRPLRAVERQAEGICNREYIVQDRIPWTRDLRKVVEAMNKMSLRVKQMFQEQAETTERLRKQVYLDPVTGLGNRAYFNTQLQHYIETAEEEFANGALFLVELQDFKGFNDRHGYELGDELLRQTARILQATSVKLKECLAAHLSGANFALLTNMTTPEEADQLAEALARGLTELHSGGIADSANVAHLGVACYRQGQTVSEFLSSVDHALRTAQSQAPNSWFRDRIAQSGPAASGASHWGKLLKEAIDGRKAILYCQPIVATTQGMPEILHREVLLRIPDENGQPLNAGIFMPMAERLGLTMELDRLAVGIVLAHMEKETKKVPYVVNLTAVTIANEEFRAWVVKTLKAAPQAAGRLVFEISEYGVLRDIEATKGFIDLVKSCGAGFSIDHFGRGFTSFGYLSSFKVDSIKIDGSYIRNINDSKDNQFFVHALTKTAHEIDIRVIAETVETETELNTLRELHVDGAMGYLIGRPEPL
jgi:diguanylate cyclase (GGDEF)-like protein